MKPPLPITQESYTRLRFKGRRVAHISTRRNSSFALRVANLILTDESGRALSYADFSFATALNRAVNPRPTNPSVEGLEMAVVIEY
jgi:hypothetical protein